AGGKRPRQLELLADPGHLVPGIEHVGHAVACQHRAVDVGQELGVAQLHRVAEVTRQLFQEGVEFLRPARGLRQVLSPHRLKLEHERTRVVQERAVVRPEHRFLEERGIQEVGIALTGEVAPTRVLVEAPGGDSVPHLAHAEKPGGERPRVGRERFFGRGLVERAVDPHRAEQRIARVLLEPPGGLRAAVGPMVHVARPAVVGPGGRAELDARGDAAGECYETGGRRRERADVVEETWLIATDHGQKLSVVPRPRWSRVTWASWARRNVPSSVFTPRLWLYTVRSARSPQSSRP